MSAIQSFDDAIKASGPNTRTVLLGNGFSIAQAGGQFSYSSLMEKSGLAKDSPIRNVFQVLKTFDFEKVMKALEERLGQCGLEMHPLKTKLVYCKDSNRRMSYPNVTFDFLGYTFKPRQAQNSIRKETFTNWYRILS